MRCFLKKCRGSYLIEMVAVMGMAVLFATTVLPQFANVLKAKSEKTLQSVEHRVHIDQKHDEIVL